MKPPMIPHQGRAIDTVNFRNVKDSASSVDMGSSPIANTTNGATAIKSSSTSTNHSNHTGAVPNGAAAAHALAQTDGNVSRPPSGASPSTLSKSGGTAGAVGAGEAGGAGGGGLGKGVTLAKSKSKEKLLVSNQGLKGVPLDSGLATPMGERDTVDPFEEFKSVTLHHDGEGGGR